MRSGRTMLLSGIGHNSALQRWKNEEAEILERKVVRGVGRSVVVCTELSLPNLRKSTGSQMGWDSPKADISGNG
jgi:hypothetical protein